MMGQLLRGGGGGGGEGPGLTQQNTSFRFECRVLRFLWSQRRVGPTTLGSEAHVEKRLCALVQDEKQAIRSNEVVARLRGAPC